MQEGEIERVGDTKVRKVNVRVIAATNVDLREMAKSGKFRQDLYFRLNVFPITVPPLRQRRDDIPMLIDWFLQRFSSKYNKNVTGLRERSLDALINYDWPGNVRELENIIERAVILVDDGSPLDLCHLFTCGEELRPESFTLNDRGIVVAPPATETINEITGLITNAADRRDHNQFSVEDVLNLTETEIAMIREAMTKSNGNLSRAARLLKITRPQLAYRLKKYCLI